MDTEDNDIVVSLTPLHKYLCSLDYYSDFKDKLTMVNNSIETKEEEKAANAEPVVGEKISLKFENCYDYINEWEEMFLLEAKAQIIRGGVTEKTSSDDFFLKSIEADDTFFIMTFKLKSTSQSTYRVFDFVVVAKDDPETPQETHMIGIVDYFNVDVLKVKVFLAKGSHKYGRIFDLVYEDSQWKIQKVCNMATLHREYQAIYSIPKISFSNVLINPGPLDETDLQYFEIPAKLNSVLQHKYNESQFAAIKSSLKKSGVTLIQGPPGTGKTNTILGILSVLLNSKQEKEIAHAELTTKKIENEALSITAYSSDDKKAHYRKAMPWLTNGYRNWRDQDKVPISLPLEKHLVYPTANMTDRQIPLPRYEQNVHTKPQRILICAPSNAAIDQIIRLVLQKGILDNEARQVFPSLVRIGPNYHESLKEVSMEYLVANEMGSDPNKNLGDVRTNVLYCEPDLEEDQANLQYSVSCRFNAAYSDE